jgi:CheY-like chemotaxis protein
MAVVMLEKLGCRVDVASNGHEAVGSADRSPYDLILMDCHMPEMDGYAATAVIRQREARTERHTPIIAMTANAMEGDRDRCLAVGMDDDLTKPVQAEDLTEIVQRWCPLPTPASSNPGCHLPKLGFPC